MKTKVSLCTQIMIYKCNRCLNFCMKTQEQSILEEVNVVNEKIKNSLQTNVLLIY